MSSTCAWGLAATGAALAGCSGQAPPRQPEASFTLLDGSSGSLQALRGKVVLVNFWATSCGVCVKEMPTLASTHARFAPQGFELLAVAMQWDAPAAVALFAQRRQLPFPVVIDNTGAVARAFGDVRATPTGMLLDRAGRVVQHWQGALHEAELQRRIERAMAAA